MLAVMKKLGPKSSSSNGFWSDSVTPPAHASQGRAAGGSPDQDHDLVAPEAPDSVAGTHDVLEPFGDVLQELVAGGLAELLVDVFEPVDVDEQRTYQQAGLAPGASEHDLRAIEHQGAVGQPGEGVVQIVVRELGSHVLRDRSCTAPGAEHEHQQADQ